MTRRSRAAPDEPAGRPTDRPADERTAEPGDLASSPDPEALFPDRVVARPDDGLGRVVARPDGFHWLTPDGRQEFGPFESIEAALADLQASDEEGPETAETLAEAEAEIGIADWIDPETGEPAQGGCPPHIEDR